MTVFNPWVTPLNQTWQEVSPIGWTTVYEGIPAHIDCLGPLLYELFQERWAEIQGGQVWGVASWKRPSRLPLLSVCSTTAT